MLDYDKDEGKYVITFEVTHKELFHIVSSLFSVTQCKNTALSFVSDYEKDVMKKFYDELLYVLSWFSQ